MKRTMTFALIALCLGGCIADAPDQQESAADRSAIIGGEPCDAADHPAVGAFWGLYTSYYGQTKRALQCTGTLIAPDTVLTASHCTFAPPDSGVASMDLYFTFALDINEYTGDGSGDPPPLSTHVKHLIYHRDFDLDSLMGGTMGMGPYGLGDYSDVGLAFLDEPVVDREPAVVLQPESGIVAEGMEVTIVGYGQRTAETNPMGPEPESGVQYQATTWVSEVGSSEMQTGDATSPATNPNKCHGDSGGPSFVAVEDGRSPSMRIVGITSRPYDPMADCTMGGVDTRADAFHEWIDEVMRWACDDDIRTHCVDGGALPLPSGGGTVEDPDAGPDGSDTVEPVDDAGPSDGGEEIEDDAGDPVEPREDGGNDDSSIEDPTEDTTSDAGADDEEPITYACGCASCSVMTGPNAPRPGPLSILPALLALASALYFRKR